MSGIIKLQVTILAGTTVTNVIPAGEPNALLRRPGTVRVLATQEVVVTSNIVLDFFLGNALVGGALRPNEAAVSGAVDRTRDGFPPAVGMPLDTIQIRARETTGVAGNDGILNLQIEVTDLR